MRFPGRHAWPIGGRAIFKQNGVSGIIDLDQQAVLGINMLGSCYGSTGPSSINPLTREPYGSSFPLVQIADVVRAQALLLDSLGIKRVSLAIGASLGGMQVIEWALQYPTRISQAVAIGAAPLGAMGLGLNHLQRQAIQLDPLWNGGSYTLDASLRARAWLSPVPSPSAATNLRSFSKSDLLADQTAAARILLSTLVAQRVASM